MNPELEWLEQAEAGWAKFELSHVVLEDNFVSGDKSGHRLTVRYFANEADQSLRAKVLLGPGVQGPPGHAHGGSMAALLDEAMGGAAWMRGHMVVAAELTTRFKKMLPLGTRCVIEAQVVDVNGRKVRTHAVLRDEAGTVFSEGDALFIVIDPARFGTLACEAAKIFSLRDAGMK
jgi:acyl-coenzyme A thioesterase PaaI-like protein